MTAFLLSAALAVVGYLLGAVPTAILLSRRFWKDDIRNHGSGNPGSTNMYRVFGWKAGVITQVLDIMKGALAAALPVLFAPQYPGFDQLFYAQLACGLAAAVGHVYTVFAGFKGGKGVNTLLGMMLVVAPVGALVAAFTFVGALLLTRMVSAGSMLGPVAFSLYYGKQVLEAPTSRNSTLLVIGLLLILGVVYTHRTNLKRIAKGTESKVPLFGKK